jgi:hypothetical protein
MENKTFTLSEANALLPQLQADLLRLQQLTGRLEKEYLELRKEKLKYEQSSEYAESGKDPFFELESRLDFMQMEVNLQIENFARKGVLLKMINPGLIDFPAVLDGEDVLICWKQGEERVTHYHGWHEGFIGRRSHPEA